MKRTLLATVLVFIFFLSGCSFYWPGMMEEDLEVFKITFLIEPDDAQIFLNGRFIGEAYEFSTSKSALKVTSRKNEIVIKKKGFAEEAIDLYEYTTKKITIKMKLKKEKSYIPEKTPAVPGEKDKLKEPALDKKKPEYIPKTLPEKESIKKMDEEKKLTVKTVPVTLEIQPPDSAIYLNGKFWGITPDSGIIKNLKLTPGKYRIEVLKPEYKTVVKIIEIKENQKGQKITIKLEKKNKDEGIVL